MLLFAATAVNAQTIVKGDMNDDNNLTIADAVSLVDVILGKSPMQTISLGGDPYKVDNALVVGTWYAPEGWSFTLSDDGTTDYPGATTYKFRPYQGTLMFYNASGRPVTTIVLNEVDASYLLAIDYATRAYTYYTKSTSLASGITLDQTSLTINSGTTAQLTATITPAEAFATITWTSSDESVATVDANGLVTAVAGGTCAITAKTSGNNKTATCSVTVKQMVTSIVLSQTTAVLESDGIVRLSATVLPVNASNKTVVWIVDNRPMFVTSAPGRYAGGNEPENIDYDVRPPFPGSLDEVRDVYVSDLGRLSPLIPTDMSGMRWVAVLVYTHGQPATKDKSLRNTYFEGYSVPNKFYVGLYNNFPNSKDFRRTLLWNPDVKTDESGNARVTFYNNSTCKLLQISAEGIDQEGKPLLQSTRP